MPDDEAAPSDDSWKAFSLPPPVAGTPLGKRKLSRWRVFGRMVDDALTKGGAVSITFAASLSALGAGGIAVGIYDASQTSPPEPPLSNAWVVVGLVLMILGFAAAAIVLGALMVDALRTRSRRLILTSCAVSGQQMLIHPENLTVKNVSAWFRHTSDALGKVDPDGGFHVRWMGALAATLTEDGELPSDLRGVVQTHVNVLHELLMHEDGP